MGKQKVHKEF